MSPEEKVTRKLRAILSADVKGYSLLMANDEAYTIKKLEAYRGSMSDLIRLHSGRVVDAVGDNLLAEFSSVVDAIQCAVEIQKDLQQKNAPLPTDKRLEFRIGVNIGDVIQEGDRIYGNGVNVAARIEALAESGGICISRNAYSHVRDKLELGYEYLGEHSVKNIKRPIRAYKVLMNPGDAGKLIGDVRKKVAKKWIYVPAVLAVIVITAVVWQVYQKMTEPEFEPAKVEEMTYPLPENPSIAVLAFDNMTGEPTQDYFCDGIAEAIITSLSRIDELFVVARNSSFVYKGKPVNIKQISEELGVRYVMEGSVISSGDQVRITAQLIDAVKGRHIWAKTYDHDFGNILKIHDDISLNIAQNLRVELTEGEQERVFFDDYKNPEVFYKWAEANSQLRKGGSGSIKRMGQLAKEVLDIEPESLIGYQMIGWYHKFLAENGISKNENVKKGFYYASKALSLNENDSFTHGLLCGLYFIEREYEKSIVSGKRAVELQPGGDTAHMVLGKTLLYAEQYDEAIFHIKKSIRLNPIPAYFNYLYLGMCYYHNGQYNEALIELKKAVKLRPDLDRIHFYLAIVYSSLDREEEARLSAKKAIEYYPYLSVSLVTEIWSYKTKNNLPKVLDAMRKAGFPEYPPGKEPPEKPSIAVLAFDNLSGDPEQEYFSDGLSEDIITALSKTDQLVVIARNSSFTYKGKPVKIKQIAEELGVRYVLEGSVRKTQDRVRITAQLIDATTEHHLWAERYDRDLKDIFALQDEITMKIVAALDVMLTSGEEGRMYKRQYKTLKGLMKWSEAGSAYNEGTKEGLIRHGQLAQELIALEPDSPGGYNYLGWNHMERARIESPEENIEKAFELAQKAISLDESNSSSYALLSAVYLQMRQYEKAIAAGEKSVALLPNGAFNHTVFGGILTYADKPGDALYHIKQGLRLDPYPESWKYYILARYYWVNKQYEEALTALNKAVHLAPGHVGSQVLLAMTYVRLDRKEEAEAAAKKVLDIYPDYSLERLSKTLPYKNQDVLQGIIDAGLKAGLPM